MKFEFSCHGCEKRSPGCHSSCEIYKQERVEYDAKKTEIAKEKAINDGIYRQRVKSVARAERRRSTRMKYVRKGRW